MKSSFLKGQNLLVHLQQSMAEHAQASAFCIADRYYTYQQLLQEVGNARHVLRNREENNIGLVVNDDLYTYASILALWMEGKSYVPLHPLWPMRRCEDIIEQVGLKTIINSRNDGVSFASTDVLYPENFEPHHHSFFDSISYNEDKLAYILFTSGSTGRPKGVAITIGNVAAFEESFFSLGIELTQNDRCLQMFDLTFDMSVGSYVAPLLCGACVYTIAPGSIKWQEVFRLIDDYEITEAQLVPSVIHYLRPYFDEIDAPAMRYVLFAGEGLPAEDVKLWQKCVPNAKIWNVYGPTENTVYSTYYLLPHDNVREVNGIVCIGKDMKHVQTLIIDDNNIPLPQGEMGELCLSGRQLTPGYWRNSEKNNEAFFTLNGRRWYHTGDICSVDTSGEIMYYGRKDSQVQIQGYRVELSEVEHVARRYFNNAVNVVALPIDDGNGNVAIALAIEAEKQQDDDVLMSYLRQYLPSYMLPSCISYINPFPLNTSNKIDRKLIKQMV